MTADQSVGAIVCLTIGVGFNAASFSGYMINHMDLSPNFAGPMMGITNGIANLLPLFAPILVTIIVKDEVFKFSLLYFPQNNSRFSDKARSMAHSILYNSWRVFGL